MFFPSAIADNPIYAIVDRITRSLSELVASVDSVTVSIGRLDVSLTHFTVPVPDLGISQAGTAAGEVGTNGELRGGDTVMPQEHQKESQSPISTNLEAAGSFFKNTSELMGKFEGLPKQATKVKDLFGIAGNITTGIEGITDLFTKEHLTLADGISAAGKIASGVMGVLEATALGPEAAVISAATMVGGSIISYVADQQEKQEAYAATKQQEHEKAMASFQMDEKAAVGYVKADPNKVQHPWQLQMEDPVNEIMRLYGKDAFNVNIGPLRSANQPPLRNYLAPITRHNAAEDVLNVQKNYSERTYDLRKRLMDIADMQGKPGLDNAALKAEEQAKQHDKIYGTNTLQETLLAIKQVKFAAVSKANQRQIVEDSPPGKTPMQQASPGGRQVVINMNKPLVEHLTITTTNMKDGVNSMRQQIEEALLDILNSADIR